MQDQDRNGPPNADAIRRFERPRRVRLIDEAAEVAKLKRIFGVDETPQRSESPRGTPMAKVSIFISHSETDKEVVGEFVELLVAAELGGVGTIFCSSKQQFDILNGLEPKQVIKDKLDSTSVVIAILTHSYWESKFSLCELGAAWVKCRLFALTVPPDTYKDAKAILSGTAIHQLTNVDKVSTILDEIAGMNDIADPASSKVAGRSARFTQLANRFAKTVEEYVERQKSKAEAEKRRESTETQQKLSNAAAGPTAIHYDGGMVPQTQIRIADTQRPPQGMEPSKSGNRGRRANKSVGTASLKPKRDINDAQAAEFTECIDAASAALNALPKVVQIALYRHTNEGHSTTHGMNPREIQNAIDNNFFETLREDHLIRLNFQKDKIEAFQTPYYRARELLEEMNADTHSDVQKNCGGVNMDPDDHDFWMNVLDYKY